MSNKTYIQPQTRVVPTLALPSPLLADSNYESTNPDTQNDGEFGAKPFDDSGITSIFDDIPDHEDDWHSAYDDWGALKL